MQRLSDAALRKIFEFASNPTGENEELPIQMRKTLNELSQAFADLRKQHIDTELVLESHDMMGSSEGPRMRGTLRVQDYMYPVGLEFKPEGPQFFLGAQDISRGCAAEFDVFQDCEALNLAEVTHDEMLDLELTGMGMLQAAVIMQSQIIEIAKQSSGGKQLISAPPAGQLTDARTLQAPRIPLRKPEQ